MIKKHSDPRYDAVIHSPEWKRTRALVMQREQFLCKSCRERGIFTPAAEVHHVQPLESIKDNGTFYRQAYNMDNLVALCRDCHHLAHLELASHSQEVKKARMREAVDEFIKNFF